MRIQRDGPDRASGRVTPLRYVAGGIDRYNSDETAWAKAGPCSQRALRRPSEPVSTAFVTPVGRRHARGATQTPSRTPSTTRLYPAVPRTLYKVLDLKIDIFGLQNAIHRARS